MKYISNTAKYLSSEKYSFLRSDDVQSFYELLEAYEPTHLLSLPDVSEILGIKELLVKDESKRFGLNAFKGLDVEIIACSEQYECCGATALLFDEELGINRGLLILMAS